MKKKILAIIVLLIVLLLIVVITIKFLIGTDKGEAINISTNDQNSIVDVEKVKSDTAYFTVKLCAEKYVNYISANDYDAVYNLLDDEYIKKFNVTKDNIKNYVNRTFENNVLRVEEMYVKTADDDNQSYYLNGILQELVGGEDTTYGEKMKFTLTVNINHDTMTFTVLPFGYGGIFYE